MTGLLLDSERVVFKVKGGHTVLIMIKRGLEERFEIRKAKGFLGLTELVILLKCPEHILCPEI
jgi:hypothetical protein